MSFQDKVVLITGGTSGIGRETAVQFASQGAKVVVAGRREEEGQETVKLVEEAGGQGLFVQTDVVDEDQVKNLVEKTVSHFGRLDIAFNNAGVEHTGATVEATAEDYRKIFDINVLGVLLSMKHEIPAMQKTGGGAIINTSSIAGHVGMAGAGVYIASKHAVEGLTKTAALELATEGIRVNAVAPGAIATDMVDRFAGEEGSEERQGLADMHPIQRVGNPPEVASAVLYLASDAASFTTGVSLPVDGGFLAR